MTQKRTRRKRNDTPRDGSVENLPCSVCEQTLPLDSFYVAKKGEGAIAYLSQCKRCFREYNAKRLKREVIPGYTESKIVSICSNYKITREYFFDLLEKQQHSCAICERSFTPTGGTKLVVDHCHETLDVRGLLCHDCNVGLGRLGDNEEGLLRALSYLRRFHEASHELGSTD